jgi:HK97 gp10 family phage protein
MFKVKITGISSIEKQFTQAAEKIRETVEQEMQAAAQDWVAGAVRDAPVDQGALKQSITYKQSNTQTQAGTSISFEIVAQRFYAPFVEFGTKGKYQPIPGTEKIAAQMKGYKGGDFMDLLRMILRWVKRKGIAGTYSVKTRRRTGSKINQYAEDYSAAWPIALSILKHGISPHPFFFKQQEVVWPAMIKRIQRVLQKETKVSIIAPGDIFRPRIITI